MEKRASSEFCKTGTVRVSTQKHKVHEIAAITASDFDAWTTRISKIERMYRDDIEKINLIYDTFLFKFPLCHVYWKKYAEHRARLCSVNDAIDVFERAVQSATYCIDVWVDYCAFSMSVFEDPADVRRLFKRAMSFVGKDYLCHILWDRYIEFEYSQQQWNSLAHIYLQTLKFPSKKLHQYFDSFKRLTILWEEEMAFQNGDIRKIERVSHSSNDLNLNQRDVDSLMKDLQDLSFISSSSIALQAFSSIGEYFYQRSCKLDDGIHQFETCIERHHFPAKSLDENQLEIWHKYLNFVEMQEDFDWAVKIYERCLISCANYPEFWMRYVEFMEVKGGREIAILALDRATQVILKNVPVIHLFSSRFKEQIGDKEGARAAFAKQDTDLNSNFVANVIKKANMEKRLGHFAPACDIYETAIRMAVEKQKFDLLPQLYISYSQLKYMITRSVAAARDILVGGIKQIPDCKSLSEELMELVMLYGDVKDLHVVELIIADVILPSPHGERLGLSDKDRVDLASRYLKLVDACGDINDITRAWRRHIKMFPSSLRESSLNEHCTSVMDLETALEGILGSPDDLDKHPSNDCTSTLPIEYLEPNDNVLEGSHQIHQESSPKPGDDMSEKSETDYSQQSKVFHLQLSGKDREIKKSPQKFSEQSRENVSCHSNPRFSCDPADDASQLLIGGEVMGQKKSVSSGNKTSVHPLVSSGLQGTSVMNGAVQEGGLNTTDAQLQNHPANYLLSMDQLVTGSNEKCLGHPTIAVSNEKKHEKTNSFDDTKEPIHESEWQQGQVVIPSSLQWQCPHGDMNAPVLEAQAEHGQHEAAVTQGVPSVIRSTTDPSTLAYMQQEYQHQYWMQAQHPNSQRQGQLQATPQHSQPQQEVQQHQPLLASQYQQQLKQLQHQQQLLYQQLLQQQQLFQQQQYLLQQQQQQHPSQIQHQQQYSMMQQWQQHIYHNLQLVQQQQQNMAQASLLEHSSSSDQSLYINSMQQQWQCLYQQQFPGATQLHQGHVSAPELHHRLHST